MIKIFLFGITGKMGKLVLNYTKINNYFIIIGGINKNNLKYLNCFKYNLLFYNMKKKSILLDFSSPILIQNILFISRYYNIPLIIGTTGFNYIELKKIKYISFYIKILISYNTSIGINLINYILINLKNKLYKFNFNTIILDIHHNKKKDYPSGTSLMFYNYLKNTNLNIFSIRIKKIIGFHIIYMVSNYELIKLEHFILDKNIFIIGIFYSIIWLLKKYIGIYSMYDVYLIC